MDLNRTADTLHAITIKVSSNIMDPTSSVDNPDFPFKRGSTVEITFDEEFSNVSNKIPKADDEVILRVGQYVTPTSSPGWVWGSQHIGYFIEQNGK